MPGMAAYALTIFTGAFLLFQVQPLIGKYILPWFGGGPGVWTTCMLFFQVLLLGGYAYAHFTSRWLKPRTQAVVHLVLLAAALALLPITPERRLETARRRQSRPCKSSRCWPSVSGCLISSFPPPARSSSNGSAAPSLAYRLTGSTRFRTSARCWPWSATPFFFETHFTRKIQAGLWAWGLVVYVVCCGFCAVRLWKSEGLRLKSEVQSPKSNVQKSGVRKHGAHAPRNPATYASTLNPQPPPLASAPRLRLGAVAGDDQQAVPGRGGDSFSLGAAAGALPVELHHLLRQPALVCALPVHAGPDRGAGRPLLGAVQRERPGAVQTGGPLLRRAFHLLHGLSRGALPA